MKAMTEDRSKGKWKVGEDELGATILALVKKQHSLGADD